MPDSGGLLAEALRDRLGSIRTLQERVTALETYPDEPLQAFDCELAQALAAALLRRALRALSTSDGYEVATALAAGRMEPGRLGMAEQMMIVQDLAAAGLAAWDPGSGEVAPTFLLHELMGLFQAAVSAAGAMP